MQEFLKTVALHYADIARTESQKTGEPASMPLSRMLFCFPNRRCGLFFSKYLHEAFGGTCFVPSITTINELFGLFSQRQVPDRTSLLFRLYTHYRRLSQRQDKEEFDQFVFWGDMLLSDFDDVDKYLVDADALFRNVKDLKDIEAEFAGFDPEIITVIQSFWQNYKPVECPDDAKREAFGQTWSILRDLYHNFRQDLANDNLAYEGMLKREVIDMLYNENKAPEELIPMPGIQKVVFVGLTAISKADRKLMLKLHANQLADFCWDYADPRLSDKDSKATSAAYFTAQNLSDFPNEISEQELSAGLVPEADRTYQLYAVPSAVGQTQLAGQILKQNKQEILQNPLRTAVVLPDEKLLLPMLYAVPSELGTFNVTMGYGLKNTPIASFVEMLANLHESMRDREGAGRTTFHFKPVLSLLSHSFVRSLAGPQAHDLTSHITTHNIYQVSVSEFQESDFLRLIFRPVRTARDTINYLLEILQYLMDQAQQEIEQRAIQAEEPTLFESDDSQPNFTVTDHEFLYHYHRTLQKLADELTRQSFDFTPRTLYLLIERLVSGVSVPFSGEPLQGLQVMGVLETRGMDFDHVILLSMNEGVFPAKPVSNTFIPMSLRNAFDMPTQRHRDAVFAYHFYRLISRAHHVTMIYDSRADGRQSGEESRYVKQLRYLMGHDSLIPLAIHNDIRIAETSSFQVEKTPEVLQSMQTYLGTEGQRNLSASALKEYIHCPLNFYLTYVKDLQEEQEVSEGVDNIGFGDILHHALEQLYSKAEGKRVEADMLRYYIDHPEGEITRLIHKSFREVMEIEELEGYNLLVSRILVRYAVEVLRQDLKRCPFIYLQGEATLKFLYKVNDNLQVRIKCIYDRLELSAIGPETLRIIDYKTGNSSHGSKLHLRDVNDLFVPDGKASHEAFQVMFYSLMLHQANVSQLRRLGLDHQPEHITPHLFFVRDFRSDSTAITRLDLGKNKQKETIWIDDFKPYSSQMTEGLNQLLTEIFDPSVPFTQCTDPHKCIYCRFRPICNR